MVDRTVRLIVDQPFLSKFVTSILAELIASAVVVLKHETFTLRQSHNFISIDSTFDVGDNVREVTSPVKFSSDPMNGRDVTWGNIYGYWLFLFFNRATAHTRESMFALNSSLV